MSEVLDDPVNQWEEGRVEDELSPEEIQMVRRLIIQYLCRSVYVDSYDSCVSHQCTSILG